VTAMLFNNNIIERSKRFLSDKGFKGGWIDLSDKPADNPTVVVKIGETIRMVERLPAIPLDPSGYNPDIGYNRLRVCCEKKVNLTNLNAIHFKLDKHNAIKPQGAFCFVGFCEEPTYKSISSSFGTDKSLKVSFESIESQRITLDVSNLTGEYHLYITHAINHNPNFSELEISRIWID
jgi:hypothetical protein